MILVLADNPTDPAEQLMLAALEAGRKVNVTVVVIGPRSDRP